MTTTTDNFYQQVMDAAGFYHDGNPTNGVYAGGVLRAARKPAGDADEIDRSFKYQAVLYGPKLDVTDIYEWAGASCIYFKHVDRRMAEPELNTRVAEWHRTTWNNGLARMLWVITPTELRVFNGFAEPPASGRVLDNPDVELFRAVAAQLDQMRRVNLLRRGIESGAFWDGEIGRRINRRQRVDEHLLEDLQQAAKNLQSLKMTASQAHTLLLQTIFVAYLEARKLLPKRVFNRLGVERFGDVVATESNARKFFARMHAELNGDLFPSFTNSNSGQAGLLTSERLNIIWRILNRTEQSGQQRFWPYDFGVVPIEFISSVYENFIRTQDEATADEESVHYTPINVVDLVLSQIFDHSLPADTKVLDLSCGSGVFLVEALRRLVAKRVAAGELLSRKLIRDTLYGQVYGVDKASEAVDVAAFSLCLMAIELDPNQSNGTPLKFPHPLRGQNLFAEDAFDLEADYNQSPPFKNRQFGAVIGNPPWTSPKGQGADQAPATPPKHIKYCETRVPPFPLARENPPDPAFVRRAADFTAPGARIGLILSATRFFSHDGDSRDMKRAVFSHYRPTVVVNLSAVHRDLFPSAEYPALAYIGENRLTADGDTFLFVTVERSQRFKRHGIIEVGPEHTQRLPTLQAALKRDVLKLASWGRPRDWKLVQRLTMHLSLEKFLASIGTKAFQGYVEGKPRRTTSTDRRRPTPTDMLRLLEVKSEAVMPYIVNARTLDTFSIDRLEAPRNLRIYRAPLLLLMRALNGNRVAAAYSNTSVVYSNLFTGIPLRQTQDREARYLNAILNSSLATYFVFLTSPAWGVERYEVRKADIMRVPIPIMSDQRAVAHVLELEEQMRAAARHGQVDSRLQAKLDDSVFDLFDLTDSERVLIRDMVNFTVDFQRQHEASRALQGTTAKELERYVRYIARPVESLLQAGQRYGLRAEIFDVSDAKMPKIAASDERGCLRAVKLTFVEDGSGHPAIEVTSRKDVEAVLATIAKNIDEELSQDLYTRRHLRIYSGNDVYVIKPDQKRFWSASAGLADADAIIDDHLGGRHA